MSFLMNVYRNTDNSDINTNKKCSPIVINGIKNTWLNNSNLMEIFEGITQESIKEIVEAIAVIYSREYGDKNFNKESFAKLVCDNEKEITKILADNQVLNSLNQDNSAHAINLICEKIIPTITDKQRKELHKNISTTILSNLTSFSINEELITIQIHYPNQKEMEKLVQDTASKINGIKVALPTRGRKPGSKMEKPEPNLNPEPSQKTEKSHAQKLKATNKGKSTPSAKK